MSQDLMGFFVEIIYLIIVIIIIGPHWVALYVNNKTVTYFDSFGVEHIPKEVMKSIGNKNT